MSVENIVAAGADPALPAAEPQPAPSVAVKALEWNPYRAETPFGYYEINDQRDVPESELKARPPFLLSGSRLDYSRHPTLEAARAVAQSDYEARIRSALSAQVQDVVGAVIKLGIYGRAYDRAEERRAYTYEHQPGNIEAHKLGRACSDIHSGGDWIDRGLNLLNSLQREGFGVFELPAAPAKQDGDNVTSQ